MFKINKIMTCLLAGGLVSTADIQAQEISDLELQKWSGGAAVDVTNISPNQRLGNDQIYLRAKIDHIFDPTDIKIYQDTGNGKAWSTTVSTVDDGSGTKKGEWVSSWNYPLNKAPATLTLRVCNPNNGEGQNGVDCTLVPGSDGNIANVDINDSVKVYGVWFHNMTDGNQAASVSTVLLRQLVDWWANGNASDILDGTSLPTEAFNADEIFDNCSVSKRIQLRYYKTDTVDASGWLPTATDWTRFDVGSGYPWLPANYGTYTNSIDPNQDYLHVYIVNSITGSTIGLANGYADNFVAIEDSYVNGAAFRNNGRLLAHEIGHTQGLYHNTSNCSGTSGSNLMCGSINTGGDALTSSQCTTMYNSSVGIDNLNN